MALPSLSICIPVKDFDVRPLVASLLTEIRGQSIRAEIIVLEDGSAPSFKELNAPLQREPEVRLLFFEENKGRSAARNFMAQEALGEYLLFVDADSLPVSPAYITLYLNQCAPQLILSGGRHYSELYRKPGSLLHWKFGVHREVHGALKTKRAGFHSNNFFIQKNAFSRVKFDESLILYGHEDTLFGFIAKASGLVIKNIDNPVIHTCLELNEIFLKKTEESIVSLSIIMQQQALYPEGIEKEFRIWTTYQKIKKNHLTFILHLFSPFTGIIRKMLFYLSGPLPLYDFYRLLLLHRQTNP